MWTIQKHTFGCGPKTRRKQLVGNHDEYHGLKGLVIYRDDFATETWREKNLVGIKDSQESNTWYYHKHSDHSATP